MSDNINQLKIDRIRIIYRHFSQEINSIQREILKILKDYYRQQDAQKLENLRRQIKNS